MTATVIARKVPAGQVAKGDQLVIEHADGTFTVDRVLGVRADADAPRFVLLVTVASTLLRHHDEQLVRIVDETAEVLAVG